MKLSVFFLLSFIYSSAQACVAPTGELDNDPSVLVSKTPTIIYAKAISSEVDLKINGYAKKPGAYRFKVITLIKGTSEQEFIVRGDLDYSGLWDTTFSNHTEANFWVRKSGHLGNIGDCVTTPPPQFIIGKSYVIFIGGPDDSKKYERVDTIKDKWLEYVLSQVKSNL